MKIAICGGTLSGATLAKFLASFPSKSTTTTTTTPAAVTVIESIDLFRCLHDPARSKSHPLCEYEPLSFSLSYNAEPCVEEEVERWISKDLVQQSGSNKNGNSRDNSPKMGVYDSSRGGSVTNADLYDEDEDEDNANGQKHGNNIIRRYQPRRGFFTLIDELIKDLPLLSSDSINMGISTKQIVALDRQPVSQAKDDQEQSNEAHDGERPHVQQHNHAWFLQDSGDQRHGPYDVVLFAYDATPRAARKASFKQLLESALPVSSDVIRSLARAVSASAMTAIVALPRTRVGFDCVRLEGVPAVRFATRNRAGDAASHRGLRMNDDEEVWTLVATPEWSRRVRSGHGGKWDKKAVGHAMVTAFARSVGMPPPSSSSSYRAVVPTFHWQGSSSLTRTNPAVGKAFSYDADAGLGFCGDVFGGQGVEGALRSATELARHVSSSPSDDNLPVTTDAWMLRTTPKAEDGDDNHDTNSIFGSCTGRDEPHSGDDLLDHTWPTAVDLAHGKIVQAADSLASYRTRRGKQQQRPKKQHSHTKQNASHKKDSTDNRSKQPRRNNNKKTTGSDTPGVKTNSNNQKNRPR